MCHKGSVDRVKKASSSTCRTRCCKVLKNTAKGPVNPGEPPEVSVQTLWLSHMGNRAGTCLPADIQSVDELKRRLIQLCCNLDQRVTNTVLVWRTLSMCLCKMRSCWAHHANLHWPYCLCRVTGFFKYSIYIYWKKMLIFIALFCQLVQHHTVWLYILFQIHVVRMMVGLLNGHVALNRHLTAVKEFISYVEET